MWMTLTVDPAAVTNARLLADLSLDELKTLAVTHGVDPNDASELPPPRVEASASVPTTAPPPVKGAMEMV